MALSASRLASAMESGIRSSIGLSGTPYPKLTEYCTALATAIVNEITANASVTATGTGQTGNTPLSGGGFAITNLPVTGGVS